jgi:hypothetical protein
MVEHRSWYLFSLLQFKELLERHILFRNGGVRTKVETTTAACLSESYHTLDWSIAAGTGDIL